MTLYKGSGSKPTIAFLLRDIEGAVGHTLWKGVIEGAARNDVNLITLYGSKLDGDDQNIIYALLSEHNIDGIVTWASSDLDKYVQFYENYYGTIPLVTVTLSIQNRPVITIDSYSGMKDAVTHLIEVHGKKRIGFIRGPENHVTASERYQAYLDVLKQYKIPFDERLVTPPGTFGHESGTKAFKTLITERKLKPGKDIDSVVSVTDVVVIGFLEECQKQKEEPIRVPEDIAIIGFNASEAGMSTFPSITTVAMPFAEQGATAVTILAQMIRGESVKATNALNANLKTMQSCGCMFRSVAEASVMKKIKGRYFSIFNYLKPGTWLGIPVSALSRQNSNIFASIVAPLFPGKTNDKSKFSSMLNEILVHFSDEIVGSKKNRFLPYLTGLLGQTYKNNTQIEAWHSVVTLLRTITTPYLHSQTRRLRAADLLDQARLLTTEMNKQQMMKAITVSFSRIDTLQTIGSSLSSALTIEELKNVLTKHLKNIAMESYFLVVYENPGKYTFPDPPPEWSYMILRYDRNLAEKGDTTEIRFKTRDILPLEILKELKGFNFLTLPLVFKKRQIGYIIVNNGVTERNIYTLLRDQVCSSFYSIMLIQELQKTKVILENTLSALKSKAAIISESSQHVSDGVNSVSSAMEESAANINHISQNVNEVQIIVNNAVSMSKKVSDIIQELLGHSTEITKITDLISDIAEQTHILSLNASIVAVKAGERGRGFSVIAQEIKDLSSKTVHSTDEIVTMIEKIQESTKETMTRIASIIEVIQQISDLSSSITTAITEQSITVNSISGTLMDAATGTKGMAEAINQIAEDAKLQ